MGTLINLGKNMSVGMKVALVPFLATVCLVGVALTGLLANNHLGNSLQRLGDERVPQIVNIGDLAQNLLSIQVDVNQSLAWEGAGYKAEVIEKLDKATLAKMKAFDVRLGEMGASASGDPETRKVVEAMRTEFQKYQKSVAQALDIKSGMLANATSFMTTIDSSFAVLRGMLDKLVQAEKSLAAEAVKQSKVQLASNRTTILAGLVVAIAVMGVLAWIIAMMIIRPLALAAQNAQQLAQGNLRVRADHVSTDATGMVLQALNHVSSNLSDVVAQIRDTASQVRQASEEIADANTDLSNRTESAASMLMDTSSAIEKLTVNLNDGAQRIDQAAGLARSVSNLAKEGGKVVDDAVDAMGSISQQTKKIGEIISVIDGIAFQTNILALNAAVEAARAGENGRGFAVVASEVRTLAQRSASAAREIRDLVGSSVTIVEQGSSRVQQAGNAMRRMVDEIATVSETVSEISNSTKEQAQGVQQVSHTIAHMDLSTQQNAAMVEQAAAVTRALKEQAEQLVQQIGVFKT
jgi:methyl-accepting chemotaxis protein